MSEVVTCQRFIQDLLFIPYKDENLPVQEIPLWR